MHSSASPREAILVGRALHAPWNEGTRVIARDFARVAGSIRPVQVLSLTQEGFKSIEGDCLPVEHIYTSLGYGAAGDYANLLRVVGRLGNTLSSHKPSVAHLVGAPMALAPWLRKRGVRVVNHITLCEQAYAGRTERLRGVLGSRLFDRWIDMYALSSPALVEPLLKRGVPSRKLAIIPPPVDTDLYDPAGREKSHGMLGLAAEDLAIVYVGSLSPLRFPVATVREGLRLASERLGRTIRFFGFAPKGTHEYNLEWSRQASAGLEDLPGVNARITLGDLTEEQKAHWFRSADAVLVPFAAPVAVEPPLTLLEAMACGAPVLVTPFANRSALVEHGGNGYVYETPRQLGELLVEAVGANRAADIRKAARDKILSEHSFATVARSAAEVWKRVEGA